MGNNMIKPFIRQVMFAVALMNFCGLAFAQNNDDWKLELTPYGWLTGLDGDISVGNRSQHFDQTFSDVLDVLNFASSARMEATHGNLILTTDIQYYNLGSTVGTEKASATFDMREFIGEFGGGYRLLNRSISDSGSMINLDLLGGARVWYFDVSLEGPLERNPGSNFSWVEPYIGPRLGMKFSDIWSASVRADFGGFGIGDAPNLTWQLIPAVDIKPWQDISIFLGYKILDTSIDRTRTNIDMQMRGPVIGATIHF